MSEIYAHITTLVERQGRRLTMQIWNTELAIGSKRGTPKQLIDDRTAWSMQRLGYWKPDAWENKSHNPRGLAHMYTFQTLSLALYRGMRKYCAQQGIPIDDEMNKVLAVGEAGALQQMAKVIIEAFLRQWKQI